MKIRFLKPDFFKDEDLGKIAFEWRLLFQGLWLMADKQGKLEDRPARIKAEVFPYDEIDVDEGLKILASPKKVNPNCSAFINRYEVDGNKYIEINKFDKHQRPHQFEKDSLIPNNPTKLNLIKLKKIKPRENVYRLKNQESRIKNQESRIQDQESRLQNTEPTDSDFDVFWKEYPNKKNKKFALKVWDKLKPPLDKVLATIEKAKKSREWLKDGGAFIPNPSTWLNAGGWDNEYTPYHVSLLSEKERKNLASMDYLLKKEEPDGEKGKEGIFENLSDVGDGP